MKSFSVFVLVFFIVIISDGLFSQTKTISEGKNNLPFYVGEDLFYNVRYGFFDLGSVQIKTPQKVEENGITLYKMMAYIDSYSGVPFVDLHVIYESFIDEQGFPKRFIARTIKEDHVQYDTYDFNYDKKTVVFRHGRGTKDNFVTIEQIDTNEINIPHQDGLSIFFYARIKAGTNRYDLVPTYHENKKSTTEIHFTKKIENTELDDVDYPIATSYLDGKMNFIGIFGLTGGFQGWFSNDDARIPIIAKLKVLVGNVTVELQKWKRGSWSPPQGFE
ncbi:MAG: DUF3108 domain-containing protein [Bacteroidota bacterium]